MFPSIVDLLGIRENNDYRLVEQLGIIRQERGPSILGRVVDPELDSLRLVWLSDHGQDSGVLASGRFLKRHLEVVSVLNQNLSEMEKYSNEKLHT